MKNNREFENILDDCLERLARGETLTHCLESYPEQAEQLEPLLRTARVASETLAILPRPEFRARARYEFQSVLQEVTAKKKLSLFNLRTRLVTAVVAISVILVSGGGTVVMASGSMPDTPLYTVKLASEEVQLALTPSDTDKAEVCVMQASRRVDEIVYLADKGDAEQVEVIAERLDECLGTLLEIASAEKAEAVAVEEDAVPAALMAVPEITPDQEASVYENDATEQRAWAGDGDLEELKTTVVSNAASNQSALIRKLMVAPESVKPALHRAIAVSAAGYGRVLTVLD
ncbi:MAG: DUF5667 domain-containing protein [Dehalococcoidales bacterium]|nr:DUF5667 domain-containing protein [Dehalococcoidales bacterium]